MSSRLFGTDGVRGIANVEPMTSETALRLGRAVAYVSKRSPHRHKILIGKDTRLSGYMLETAMASGICSMGVDVLLVGPLPTPGIAFLTRSLRADAGVVISASHNPFQDNGIKFFSPAGFKLPDDLEAEIERLVLSDSIDTLRPTATEIGKAFRIDDAVGRYNVFAKNTFPRHLTLDGVTLAIDCAHGAGYKVAPEVLEELGARVVGLGVDPNGENINANVGALHPQSLQEAVKLSGAQVGIALDGDADRCILVDERGEVVDGDDILAILATELHARGELKRGALVATVMSNLGLHTALRERGITIVTTPVGDRYVVEELVKGGYNLGGEQSGHIVFLDHNTTGDGLITALAVLALLVEKGQPLSQLRKVMTRFPQVLVNLRVASKPDVTSLPKVAQCVAEAERTLGERGRVLVRYSGTEPLLRVMIEGEREPQIRTLADRIVDAARDAIGER
ncbi:MAG TPA: phosphoglucosamine mutase [Candidatus Eisenbacteria bacterium]|nr:phosphoglucosamine mutase [Candidatus Eisenbacteria bacterium]